MIVLAIETSCDETSAAVVKDNGNVLSNIVYSQVKLHEPFAGVVPELAARAHVELLPLIISVAVKEAHIDWSDVDLVSATYGPGLSPSLVCGLSAGKALAIRLGVEFCAVNHIEGHIYSPFLNKGGLETFKKHLPFIALVVSGGHTLLYKVVDFGDYIILGQTLDDAAGEAFDKAASILRLGYPGGPVIDRLSQNADPSFFYFPRGEVRSYKNIPRGMDPKLCFSFSGLKTSLKYYVSRYDEDYIRDNLSSIAASFQEAVVDALCERVKRVLPDTRCVILCGGVVMNKRLRMKVRELCEKAGVALFISEPSFCTDNAAMIGGVAEAGGGIRGINAWYQDASPSAILGRMGVGC